MPSGLGSGMQKQAKRSLRIDLYFAIWYFKICNKFNVTQVEMIVRAYYRTFDNFFSVLDFDTNVQKAKH